MVAYADGSQRATRRPYGPCRAHPSGPRRRSALAPLRGAAAAHRGADRGARRRLGALALPALRRPRGALPGRGRAAVRAHRADAGANRRVVAAARADRGLRRPAHAAARDGHPGAARGSAARARVRGRGRLAPEHAQAEGAGGRAGVPPRARDGRAAGARRAAGRARRGIRMDGLGGAARAPAPERGPLARGDARHAPRRS